MTKEKSGFQSNSNLRWKLKKIQGHWEGSIHQRSLTAIRKVGTTLIKNIDLHKENRYLTFNAAIKA